LIRYNNLIYQFVGATTPQLFSQLGGITQIVASGFNQLSDPAKINVKPRRIAIKEVARNASVSEVLIQHGIQKQNLEEHALLNGMTLNQSIDKGTLIKFIVGVNFSDLAVKK
jgi:predicted Zn-dependent protease